MLPLHIERRTRRSLLPLARPLLFFSPPPPPSPHRYEPCANSIYLFGALEPRSVGIVLPGGDAVLFCERQKTTQKALWDGQCLGPENAKRAFAVDEAFAMDELEKRLGEVLGGKMPVIMGGADGNIVQLVKKIVGSKEEPEEVVRMQKEIDRLRVVKSEYERGAIREACKMTSAGHLHAMKSVKMAKTERVLQAEIECEFARQGAKGVSFTTIIGGGPRACTLHYVDNCEPLNQNQLVLMDAGARTYDHYAGDVTRTIPVSGKFTTPQRDAYEAVLDVQSETIRFIRAGLSLADVQKRAVETFETHLDRLLGVMPEGEARTNRARKYFPHGVSHYLGLDVHDTSTIERQAAIPENAVITVEPGLYFPLDDLDVPGHFRGIGIRIEDDVLVTELGCEILTRTHAPVKVDDIERKM